MTTDFVFFLVFASSGLFLAVGTAMSLQVLRSSPTWRLDQAIAEDGKPSASRLILLLGLFITGSIEIAIGYACVWRLLSNLPLPSLAELTGFLVGGVGLFTPYFANRVGAAFTAAPVTVQGGTVVAGQPGATAPATGAGSILNLTALGNRGAGLTNSAPASPLSNI